MKLNPTGTMLFSKVLGGSGTDSLAGVAVDGAGNWYVGGVTDSSDFSPAPTAGVVKPVHSPGDHAAARDGFVVKMSPSGSVLYSTFLGGSSGDTVLGMAVGPGGAVYVTGGTGSPDFAATPGAFDTGHPGNLFVAGLNPAASEYLYVARFGTHGDVRGIAVDGLGNAHVVGSTNGTTLPDGTPRELFEVFKGFYDSYYMKFDSAGALLHLRNCSSVALTATTTTAQRV